MEPIIVLVGFLGAGKTTMLGHLAERYLEEEWRPFIVLNDYENAYLDAGQLPEGILPGWVKPLNGSCICCSGINELRDAVNRIPERPRGVTLIEANGTSDACSLMGFLGVGIEERFKPPVQVSVVDVRNWQRRDSESFSFSGEPCDNNELEASQIQVSTLIVLNYVESVSEERRAEVEEQIKAINPYARLLSKRELTPTLLSSLLPSTNTATKLEHKKAHWSSCSIDLPALSSESSIERICERIPASILRVKGCTRLREAEGFTFFERLPDGTVHIRPYRGKPVTGPKLLTIGPGSDPEMLRELVEQQRL